MMKWLDYPVRWLVGGLFIFSGFVKLVDPRGTEIKLSEYFEVFASDFGSFFHLFIPAALPIGVFLIILEIVLGVAVLLRYKMVWTSRALAVLIVFFTFLTFYSAWFNKVTDCGCFGDAIPLTPWQSFGKDVLLTVLIGYLLWRSKHIPDALPAKVSVAVLGTVSLVSLFTAVYAIRHLPPIDFRPYAVGENIRDNMQPPEQPVFVYTFEKDGKKIKSERYLPEKDGYKYVGHEITNADRTIPRITDYNIWNEEMGDYTEQSLQGAKLLLIIYEVKKADKSHMDDIVSLIKGLDDQVEVLALTASFGDDFKEFLQEYGLDIPFFYADATVLKAMIRSSPGIMLLNDGTVLGKWHYNDTPTADEVKTLLLTKR